LGALALHGKARRDEQNKFIWPGFGDNLRVLRWVIERCRDAGDAQETPIGYLPTPAGLNGGGLNVSQSDLGQLLSIDREGWRQNLKSQSDYFDTFGDHLPAAIKAEHEALGKRLKS
jgi:phosphoenolpyruvate carboxykinase (GTP)